MDRPEIESIWRYGYFQLAVGLPLLGCILLSGYVAYGDNLSWAGWDGGSEALALFGEHFKWPLAVLALAFPFGAWAIADMRSKEMQRSLNQQRATLAHHEKAFMAQEEKRALDLYLGKANHVAEIISSDKSAMASLSKSQVLIVFSRLFGNGEKWPLTADTNVICKVENELERINGSAYNCESWLTKRKNENLSKDELLRHDGRDTFYLELDQLDEAISSLKDIVGLSHCYDHAINASLNVTSGILKLLAELDTLDEIFKEQDSIEKIRDAIDSLGTLGNLITWYCQHNEIDPQKHSLLTLVKAVDNRGFLQSPPYDKSEMVP